MWICEAIWERILFAKQMYLWGWRWVVFVIWGLPYGIIGIYDTAIGQEFLPDNLPRLGSLIPDWLPDVWLVFGMAAIFLVTFEGAYHIVRKKTEKTNHILPNRQELITAIHQVQKTAGGVIMSHLSLSNIKERGGKPLQNDANKFSIAFDKYQNAQTELERQELIAPEIFHEPINIFRAEIDSCVQNPAPPEKAINSNVVNVNTEENASKLYDTLNKVISKINEIRQ